MKYKGIKMNLEDIRLKVVDGNNFAEDVDRWQAPVRAVMDLLVQ
jgi:hypothetical protein